MHIIIDLDCIEPNDYILIRHMLEECNLWYNSTKIAYSIDQQHILDMSEIITGHDSVFVKNLGNSFLSNGRLDINFTIKNDLMNSNGYEIMLITTSDELINECENVIPKERKFITIDWELFNSIVKSSTSWNSVKINRIPVRGLSGYRII